MSVTEQLMGHGAWSIRLDGLPDDTTPAEVWEALDPESNAFGHILITPVRVDPDAVGDAGMLTMSRYTGIYRGNGSRSEIGGVGLVAWLGDEDGKGDISETAVTGTGGGEFDDWVTDVLPASIAAGTITAIGVGTPFPESMLFMTPRAMLARIMDFYGGVYRVNPDFTLDAGTEANLFNTTPEIVLIWKGSGPDTEVHGIRASSIDLSRDLEDYTTRVIMLAEGQGDSLTPGGPGFGSADAGSVPYKDGLGNTVVMKRLINAPDVSGPNADTLAAAQLGRFNQVRKSYSLSTDEWGVAVLKRGSKRLEPGDSIYVYDPRPDAKLVDLANQVTYQGSLIFPVILRLEAITWPIQEGMGVYFRYYSGATPVWIDLTNHVIWETGATTLDVGAAQRKLTTDPTPAQVQARIMEFGADEYQGVRVRGFTITDKTTFSAVDAMEDWGSANLVGGVGTTWPIFITAQLTGSMLTDTGVSASGRIQVGISVDGGSSYTYGIDNWCSAIATTRRSAACASHARSATPTGDIYVKVQALISGGATTDIDFMDGTLTVQTAPG